MSTGLIKRESFALLNDSGSEAKDALKAMIESGMTISPKDLLRVKVPSGGGTRWVLGDSALTEIIGALVHFQQCSLLWPSEEAVPGQLPVLRSWDGITGERVGPMSQSMAEAIEKWRLDGEPLNGRTYQVAEASGFPHSQWGTGKNGRGKRMKDQRILFVLRPEDLMPLVVNIPPASIKAFDKFIKEQFQITKAPYFRYMIGLSLKAEKSADGNPYAEVVPRVISLIERDVASDLRAQWGERLKTLATKLTDAPSEE